LLSADLLLFVQAEVVAEAGEEEGAAVVDAAVDVEAAASPSPRRNLMLSWIATTSKTQSMRRLSWMPTWTIIGPPRTKLRQQMLLQKMQQLEKKQQRQRLSTHKRFGKSS
jgi:hypothetical protein